MVNLLTFSYWSNQMEKPFEFFISLRVTNSQLFVFVFIHLFGYFYTGVTVSKYSPEKSHCVKSVQMRSFFWSVFSYIWTKYRKIQTRKSSVFGHFSRSEYSQVLRKNCSPSINLLVNRYTFQKINTPHKFGGLECGIFTFKYGREGDNIFLGSM